MGTFSRITLTSMFGTQLERPVLSQNDKTYRGRPRLQPVRCDQCIFFIFFSRLTQNGSITAGWTRWQANLYYIFHHL